MMARRVESRGSSRDGSAGGEELCDRAARRVVRDVGDCGMFELGRWCGTISSRGDEWR